MVFEIIKLKIQLKMTGIDNSMNSSEVAAQVVHCTIPDGSINIDDSLNGAPRSCTKHGLHGSM